MMKKILSLLLVTFISIGSCMLFSSCEVSSDLPTVTVEDAAYYQKFIDSDISINVYNWGEYISDGEDGALDINEEFTNLTGIKVNYSTYATNEELYAKLKAGAANYDVIIPSDYMISRMIDEGMLEKLDRENIPNYKNIMDNFTSPEYDASASYSVPYTWGTVGIIFDKNEVTLDKSEIDWEILWDENYSDKILMFDNPRDAFAIAEIILGYSLNTENSDELNASAAKLLEQKNVVQAYVMDEIFDKMGAGEAVLAPYYAGDAVTLMADYENLDFVVPESGTNMFIDAMCIPKGAKQKEAAEMYINFMCEPEVALATTKYIGYSTPNKAAFELLDAAIKNDGISYPDNDYLTKHTTVFRNLSPDANQLMQDLWTKMKSQN